MKGVLWIVSVAGSPLPPLPLELVAFGDWGRTGKTAVTNLANINTYLHQTMAEGVMLLGDNFYPNGIDPELGYVDPRFDIFPDVLAEGLDDVPFYTILGNHDIRQGPNSWGAQLDFGNIQRNWVMPSRNYFIRLEHKTCVWFIDTSEGRVNAMNWLTESLAIETNNCSWKLFASHYPLVTKGQYRRDRSVQYIRSQLLPLINMYSIHLHISGHDHNSQLLKDVEMPGCKFFVVGAICDIIPNSLTPGGKPSNGTLVWGSDREQPVVARFTISRDRIEYAFVRVSASKHTVLREGRVNRREGERVR
jgi:hypothetical protein